MKKRLLRLTVLASACGMTVACQPKTPKALVTPCCPETEEAKGSCQDQDEIDSGAYGSNDTSSQEEQVIAPVASENSEQATAPVLSEIKQVLEVTLTRPIEELKENEASADVVVLEAVNSVEIKPQFQEEPAQH